MYVPLSVFWGHPQNGWLPPGVIISISMILLQPCLFINIYFSSGSFWSSRVHLQIICLNEKDSHSRQRRLHEYDFWFFNDTGDDDDADPDDDVYLSEESAHAKGDSRGWKGVQCLVAFSPQVVAEFIFWAKIC